MDYWIRDDHGEDVLEFRCMDWSGCVIISCGANLLSLQHEMCGEILNRPGSLEEFKEMPEIWGCPVLFPPNRIENGHFRFNGREYNFPINDTTGMHHIHGMLSRNVWGLKETSRYSLVFSFINDTDKSCYEWFAHPFCVELKYEFFEKKVAQSITFENIGNENFPFGTGFHTAFRVATKDVDIESGIDFIIKATVGEYIWGRNGYFPTGEKILTPCLRNWDDGINPSGVEIDIHTPIMPNANGEREVSIVNPITGVRIRYIIDRNYNQWVLWNYQGKRNLFCAEPQTWVINAPNMSIGVEESGLRSLAPTEQWNATNYIAIDNI